MRMPITAVDAANRGAHTTMKSIAHRDMCRRGSTLKVSRASCASNARAPIAVCGGRFCWG